MRHGKTWAGFLLLFGAMQFVLCLAAAETLRPAYSVRQNMISELGVGQNAILFNASIALLGICAILSAYFMLKHFNDTVLFALMCFAGLGAIGVGAFPMNTSALHAASALCAFFFGALSAIWSAKYQRMELAALSVALGIISLVALCFLATRSPTPFGPGGIERFVKFPVLIWGLLFGGSLLAKKEEKKMNDA